MKERQTNFDALVPIQDTAEKIGHRVTELLIESKPWAPGVYYGTSRGVKYEYWARPGSSNLSYGPVDSGAHRMVPIARGARIEGTPLTHQEVMTAITTHDAARDAAKMIHNLGLIDAREAFEYFVNDPYAEAFSNSAASPISADLAA